MVTGGAAGAGATLTLPAAVQANNLLLICVTKRGADPNLSGIRRDNAVGPLRPFTDFTAVAHSVGADGTTIGWRDATGDEQTLYVPQSDIWVAYYELAGDRNIAAATTLRLQQQSSSAFKDLGLLSSGPGHFAVMSFLWDQDFDLTAYHSPSAPWTEDLEGGMGTQGLHPWTLFAHHGLGITVDAAISGISNGAWGGIAVDIPSSTQPAGMSGPQLIVEYFDNNATTFGPSTLAGVIADAVKVGWSWYSRYPANAFFTLRQDSIHNARLLPLRTHIKIHYYNPATGYRAVVFSGRLGEPDESGEDVVWTVWNYLAELSLSRTGYRVMYPNKLIGTEIAAVEWNLAKTADSSLLNHVATGTIQDPLGSDAVTPIKTDSRFGVIDVPRLLLMFDLTEIGRANTVNNVTMGISRESPTFSFLKNAGTLRSGLLLGFPGVVRDFRFVPGYASLRNDLATIGTSAAGGAVEIIKTDEANADTYGRRQDVFTIKTLAGLAGAATEADAQAAITERAVKEATSLAKSLALELRPGVFEPFDGWDIEDTVKVQISRGRTVIDATYRIVGVRGLKDQRGYHPQLIVQLPTAA